MTNKHDFRFISLRWRLISPLFLVVLLVAVVGAYVLAQNVSGGLEVSQQNVLLQNVRAVADRTDTLYAFQREEARRVAFTSGVAAAVREGDAPALQTPVESLLRLNSLDSVIVTDINGREVVGLLRSGEDYAVSTDTDLAPLPILDALRAGDVGTGLLNTANGIMLYTGVPISQAGVIVGYALVGQTLDSVLTDLQGSATADLTFYGPDADILQSTLISTDDLPSLAISPDLFTQATTGDGQIPTRTVTLRQVPYQSAYQPFAFGDQTLGVVAVLLPDDLPFITETGRQLTAIFAALLAGAVVTVAYIGISRVTTRSAQVTQVAAALQRGEHDARTAMQPTDEISATGHALDRYAESVQAQQDQLQHGLRRQRRELNHLVMVIDTLPGGVVVQDSQGRVVVINDTARQLLGSHRIFRSSGLHELASVVAAQLGPALMPGLYTLGAPQRLALDERMLSAQAAAVMSMNDQRIGTVILLRDITDEVRLERERELMLIRLARDIQQPLALLGRAGSTSDSPLVNVFAREVTRQSVALQKMIMDMRELAHVDLVSLKRRQRALRLETLLWAVANEWRQIAQANSLTLHVVFEQKGLYILGDEKRLRWAIGNIVDNAIKYNVPGGALTLEINGEQGGMASLRVRDNGVGLSKQDRQNAFLRFYRGTPTTTDGEVIRAPGMGQGLYIARQIVEGHGGAVKLKSAPGVGTAVYFSLPLTAPVRLELPQFQADMEGETVQLPVSLLAELDRD